MGGPGSGKTDASSPAELRDGAWLPKPGNPTVKVWVQGHVTAEQALENRRAAYRRTAAAAERDRLKRNKP